jgi:hypothetical protein
MGRSSDPRAAQLDVSRRQEISGREDCNVPFSMMTPAGSNLVVYVFP